MYGYMIIIDDPIKDSKKVSELKAVKYINKIIKGRNKRKIKPILIISKLYNGE